MKRAPLIGPGPLPRAKRPHCLSCGKDLRPRIRMAFSKPNYETPPTAIPVPGFTNGQLMWRVFTGNYGDYGDNRFCGLNCGYKWAVQHARKP